ncbi:MAG TPA: response regulator [Bacillaceae bacterium]
MRYFIVDDDPASRKMLANIILEGGTGDVIGEAENGVESLQPVLSIRPDVVLMDLLMPELDGIETMEQLKAHGFQGQFIMISQIINKDMVGEAYEKGVEYFIHKPINRIEVHNIVKKSAEQLRLKQSLLTIRESLAHMESAKPQKPLTVKEAVLSILNELGVAAEAGSRDMVAIMEFLFGRSNSAGSFPPLKELYEAAVTEGKDVKKESKSIEQRVRRAIMAAMNNLATMGSIDYTNPAFEYYAPRYFDFQEIRLRMRELDEFEAQPSKVKVNIKKFLQVLYLETGEKLN